MTLRLTTSLVFLATCCLQMRADEIEIATVERAQPVRFGEEILPLLRRNCVACHNAREQEAGLVLESAAAMRKGGDSGPAIIPGRGAESLLLKLAAHQDEPVMPPEDNDVNAKPFTSSELGLLRLWIDQGARDDATATMLSPKQWSPLPANIAPVYSVAPVPRRQAGRRQSRKSIGDLSSANGAAGRAAS